MTFEMIKQPHLYLLKQKFRRCMSEVKTTSLWNGLAANKNILVLVRRITCELFGWEWQGSTWRKICPNETANVVTTEKCFCDFWSMCFNKSSQGKLCQKWEERRENARYRSKGLTAMDSFTTLRWGWKSGTRRKVFLELGISWIYLLYSHIDHGAGPAPVEGQFWG